MAAQLVYGVCYIFSSQIFLQKYFCLEDIFTDFNVERIIWEVLMREAIRLLRKHKAWKCTHCINVQKYQVSINNANKNSNLKHALSLYFVLILCIRKAITNFLPCPNLFIIPLVNILKLHGQILFCIFVHHNSFYFCAFLKQKQG